MTEPAQPYRVFISYSHDSPEHKNKVLNFSDRLRCDGIDCRLDQYEQAPPEGWPRWTEKEIRDADYVLMICTETYYRRVMGEEKPDIGLGVRWEGNMVYQHLYNAETVNRKFIPVLLTAGDKRYIPTAIQGVQHYPIYTERGYEDLYRRLTNQPSTLKPEIGKLRSLPPRKPRAEFVEATPPPDRLIARTGHSTTADPPLLGRTSNHLTSVVLFGTGCLGLLALVGVIAFATIRGTLSIESLSLSSAGGGICGIGLIFLLTIHAGLGDRHYDR